MVKHGTTTHQHPAAEGGCWTEDGQYATALLTETTADGDFIMVGFNATTYKDLQKFVDAYFDLSLN